MELAAGGDSEFREDPVQVHADGAVRDIELLTDFPVRQASGGQARDQELLRRQLIPGLGGPVPARLAGGPQFPACLLGQVRQTEGVEPVSCRPQRGA